MEDITIFENNIYGVYITPNGDLKIDTGYHYNSEYLFISSAEQWKSDTPEALPKYLHKILYKTVKKYAVEKNFWYGVRYMMDYPKAKKDKEIG